MTETPAADRTMVLERVIDASRARLWAAWTDPASLPKWWGPDGHTCRTDRIGCRAGGEWLFDMIGPDGTLYPNHHKYTVMIPEERIEYTLHAGENGPKHADAMASFEDLGGRTRVTLRMVFNTREDYEGAKSFGAIELGLQTLGKLARFAGAT